MTFGEGTIQIEVVDKNVEIGYTEFRIVFSTSCPLMSVDVEYNHVTIKELESLIEGLKHIIKENT